MQKKQLSRWLAAAIFSLSAAAAQANEFDFNGVLGNANQIDTYNFTITTLSQVNLYTTSDYPVDPLLTLWSQTGSDWQEVATNDNRVGANFGETINALDAKIVQTLSSGNYEATVSWSGNTPIGSLLSAGFSLNGNAGRNLNDSYNPYYLTIVTTPVPLPATVWLFGSMLMGFLGWQKKRA